MNPETPQPFKGIQKEDQEWVRIPASFITELLAKIETLNDLRLLLYFFWHIEQQQMTMHFISKSELSADPSLLEMIGDEKNLNDSLENLQRLNILLSASPSGQEEMLYFINGPQGRAAVEAIKKDQWQVTTTDRKPIQLRSQPPNIFRLYEENIGPLTPMIADILKEDEKAYPETWIREAVEIAVMRNVRNWKYIKAILERWQKEGRRNEQNRRDDSQDPSRYRKSWLGEE